MVSKHRLASDSGDYRGVEADLRFGGNVAENAGGGRAVKYGVTGRYIHGLEVVTPVGDIIELGGTISGEHVIGHKRRDYMKLVMPPAQLEVMRRIKSAMDPNYILNPGKIFSRPTT